MAAQAVDLIAQGLLGDFKIFRLPARPALPEIATAPSGHHEDALVVGDVEKLLRLEFALEPDGIQSHVFHVAEFVAQALGGFAKHHVGSPAAAADENIFAVDMKGASAGGVYFGSDLANAELRVCLLGHERGIKFFLAEDIDVERQAQPVQFRLTHLRGPPQARIREDELREVVGSEGDVFAFVSGEFNGLLEGDGIDLTFQRALHGLIGSVF
jgi:hypothetical protein